MLIKNFYFILLLHEKIDINRCKLMSYDQNIRFICFWNGLFLLRNLLEALNLDIKDELLNSTVSKIRNSEIVPALEYYDPLF